MILRKPYAFFIKHFRLFHFIIFVFLGIITYRTILIREFFSSYLNEIAYVISSSKVDEIFSNSTYIWIGIVILFSEIVFVVMKRKNKPSILYAITIFSTIGALVFIIFSKIVITDLTKILVDVQTLRAYRDISNILLIIQIVLLIMTFVRSIGFDIKKFDFKKDVKELSIDLEDNEEVEVQFNFDWNESKKRFRKKLREFRYFLIENKKMIIIFLALLIIIIWAFIYWNFGRFIKNYKLNSTFSTDNFTMKITNSYLTQQDYKLNKITDGKLVIVAFEASGNERINMSKVLLKIENETYYPVDNMYKDKFIDLGKVYDNQKLESDFSKYIFVFEIPEHLKKDEKKFVYLGNYEKTLFGEKFEEYTVNLDPIDLDTQSIKENYNITQQVSINNQSLNGTFIINNYEISKMFTNKYKYCFSSNECYELDQYLQAGFTGNVDKAVIKLNGEIKYDDNSIIKDNLSDLIEKYGYLVYKDESDNKYYDLIATNFKFKKDSDNFYLEVPSDLINANSIDLILRIRNKEYVYKLK